MERSVSIMQLQRNKTPLDMTLIYLWTENGVFLPRRNRENVKFNANTVNIFYDAVLQMHLNTSLSYH